MTNRLRLVLTFIAAGAVALVAPSPFPSEAHAAGEAYAAKKKKKPAKPAPPPAQPAQTPAPADKQPAPAEPQPEIEVNPDQPVEINPEAPASQPASQPGGPGGPGGPEAAEAPAAAPAPGEAGEKKASWEDVVVVMRKPFLKSGRFELEPVWGVTLNDNMIRHHQLGGQVKYWLTDVLAVGVEGQKYEHFDFLEPYDLVQTTYKRLPTLNEYVWGAALNFHYAPVYAKFAVFNKWLVHWEGMFTAGVGITESSVLPRDPNLKGWNNYLITPNVGFQARVFLTRWITFNLGIRDYIFADKFESVKRCADATNPACMSSVEDAKKGATTQLINNVMFTAGFSFWLPTGFQYTTFR
jgi:outer membrane beta-barrel protein